PAMPAWECSSLSHTMPVTRLPAARSTSHQPCRPWAWESAGMTSSLTCSMPAERSSADSPSKLRIIPNIGSPSVVFSYRKKYTDAMEMSSADGHEVMEPEEWEAWTALLLL